MATFFVATTETNGTELWITNGTDAGTTLLKDLAPGDLSPDFISEFVTAGGKIYFSVYTAAGMALWSSDGTAAGTIELHNFGVDTYNLFTSVVGDKVVVFPNTGFNAAAGAQTRDVWVSDGTVAGTQLLADIDASILQTGDTTPIFSIGDKIAFRGYSAEAGWELWATDGTAAGTGLVADSVPGTGNGLMPASGGFVDGASVGGQAYYIGADLEAWVSDGTAAGTYQLADIDPTGGSFAASWVQFGSNVLFTANDGVHGRELWITDGTTAGTQMVVDINPDGSGISSAITVLGSHAFFFGIDPVEGYQAWATDGTAQGTVRLSTGASPYLDFIGALGDRMIYGAADTNGDMGIWISDGTLAGTSLLKEFGGLSASYFPSFVVGNELVFVAEDATNGSELWRTDGTAAGTQLISEINPGPDGAFNSNSIQGIVEGTTLLFQAYDELNGFELRAYEFDHARGEPGQGYRSGCGRVLEA